MIIPINLSPPIKSRAASLQPALAELGNGEFVLIELQGWLDVVEGEKPEGFIGTLKMQNDRPVLVIGNHHLDGKLVKLPKSLAVLQRRKENRAEYASESTYYDMVAIVKRKVTFSARPVPIVMQSNRLIP